MAVMDVLSPEKRELPARGAIGGVLVSWDARELPGSKEEQLGSTGEVTRALGKASRSKEGGEALFYWMEDAC